MDNAKYVVIEFSPLIGETIFIFPASVPHKDFTDDMCHHRMIISAGFVILRDGEFICHGESISLKVKSRPADDALLAKIMFRRV